MTSRFYIIAFAFLTTISSAFANPTGIYDVEGANPGNGPAYEGSVTVEKNGATYIVVWNVGGEEYIGTAIGAANVNGILTFGNAAENDTALTVSYVSGDSFGLALFAEQKNGQWKGIWTYGGSDSIGSETWTPQ